jgi:type I restriction enzyme S subunit
MNSADTSKWVTLRNSELIKDKVLEIGDGYRAKNSEMDSEGLPFARASNIKDGFQFLNADILGKKSVVKAGNKVAKINDVVLTTKGTFGRVALVRQNTEKFVYSPQLCYWRVKNYSVIHPRFLYYWIQGPEFLTQAHQVKSSTDMADYTNLKDQRAMSITAPTIDIQEKIAAILSAYDDLIENNKRRIALLENMAEEIYREWFVRMRFPEYENVKFVKGVPEDWRNSPSIEVFDVLSGGTPKTNIPAYWDGDIPFFTPKDAKDNFYVLNTEKSITANGLRNCNSRLYRKNTIFITARGTVGKLVLAQRDMAMNQSCYALLPKAEGGIYFYFLSLNNAIMYIKGISKSGVFDNIIVDTFKVIPIVMPSKPVIDKFNSKVGPLFEQISCLSDKNEILRTSRDMLLGRLISGKPPVEFLDIQFPPSIQTEQDAAHA